MAQRCLARADYPGCEIIKVLWVPRGSLPPEDLRALREIVGWTIGAAADAIGVNRVTWASWERKADMRDGAPDRWLKRILDEAWLALDVREMALHEARKRLEVWEGQR